MNDNEKKDNEIFENIELPPPKKPINFSIKIESSLFRKLSKHIQAIEYVEGTNLTKKRWIEKALKNKIKKLKSLNISEMENDKNLHIYVSKQIDQEMDEIIEKFRKQKISISKAKIIIEAISEQIKEEEINIKQQLNNLLKLSNQNEPLHNPN